MVKEYVYSRVNGCTVQLGFSWPPQYPT